MADNRVSHPLDFFLCLKFQGKISFESFEQAICRVLPFHPFLNATIQDYGLKWRWNHSSNTAPVITHHHKASASESSVSLSAIDLRSEPGVRSVLESFSDGGKMIFQFHHVASDGLGAFGFVRDVIKVLNNPELPEELRDTSRVVERYDLGYGRDSIFQLSLIHI